MLITKADNVEVNPENGHKYAVRDIKCGENVIKYANPIGHALCDIKCGKSNKIKHDEISVGLIMTAMKYFNKMSEKVDERYWPQNIRQFKKNLLQVNTHFINVVSMDFADIVRLSENKRSELNKELEETLRRYLDRNLF